MASSYRIEQAAPDGDDHPGLPVLSGVLVILYRILSAAFTRASSARMAWRASHRRMKATNGRQAANSTWNVKPVISIWLNTP